MQSGKSVARRYCQPDGIDRGGDLGVAVREHQSLHMFLLGRAAGEEILAHTHGDIYMYFSVASSVSVGCIHMRCGWASEDRRE